MLKNKNHIFTKISSLFLFLVSMSVFVACVKDIPSPFSSKDLTIRLSLPKSPSANIKSGNIKSINEDDIEHVLIFIFNGNGTKLEKLCTFDLISETNFVIKDIIEPTKNKTIYAIANWTDHPDFGESLTESILNEIYSSITHFGDINGSTAYPLLMSAGKSDINLSQEGFSISLELSRQLAKIETEINMNALTISEYPQIEWLIDDLKINLINIPTHSYITDKRSTAINENTFINSSFFPVKDLKPNAGDPTFKWKETFYTHENLTSNMAQAYYLLIQLPYKDKNTHLIVSDNYYKMYIKTPLVSAVDQYKVRRNYFYKLYLELRGLGSPLDGITEETNVSLTIGVSPWFIVEQEIDGEGTKYLNIDHSYMDFQSTDIDPIGTTKVSTIMTDVTDWRLVSSETGEPIFSFADGQTVPYKTSEFEVSISGTVSNAKISVKRLSANFTDLKFKIMAKNLALPFVIVNDNGFISSAELKAAGWTSPPNKGIQIAKRGYAIMPDYSAKNSDPQLQWKTSASSTPNTGSQSFGAGKNANIAMMLPENNTNGVSHPAAAYCQSVGAGWYLPSLKELEMLSKKNLNLGKSYQFEVRPYWSASENTATDAWSIDFTGSTQIANEKTVATNSVRCIRNID